MDFCLINFHQHTFGYVLHPNPPQKSSSAEYKVETREQNLLSLSQICLIYALSQIFVHLDTNGHTHFFIYPESLQVRTKHSTMTANHGVVSSSVTHYSCHRKKKKRCEEDYALYTEAQGQIITTEQLGGDWTENEWVGQQWGEAGLFTSSEWTVHHPLQCERSMWSLTVGIFK